MQIGVRSELSETISSSALNSVASADLIQKQAPNLKLQPSPCKDLAKRPGWASLALQPLCSMMSSIYV